MKKTIEEVKSYCIKECPICHNKKINKAYTEKLPVRLYNSILVFKRTASVCRICDVLFMSESLPKPTMKRVYESGIINASPTHTENVELERYEFILKNINKNKKLSICDIGCNTGDFLVNFNPKEWNRHGVEISAIASKICRERLGIHVDCIDWEEVKYKSKFDIITIIHTIEHSYNPVQFLNNCFNALKKNGVIYLETNTFNDIRHPSINPHNQTHIFGFSINSIVYLLKKCGFYIIRIEEEKSKHYESKVCILATKQTPTEFVKEERKNVMNTRKQISTYINKILLDWTKNKKQIYIYGAGNNAMDMILTMKNLDDIHIQGFIDKDEKKVGGNILGVPIISFKESIKPDCILILSKLGLEKIMYKHIIKKYPNIEICCPFISVIKNA